MLNYNICYYNHNILFSSITFDITNIIVFYSDYNYIKLYLMITTVISYITHGYIGTVLRSSHVVPRFSFFVVFNPFS